MKIVNGLSLASKENIHVSLEKDSDDLVVFDVSDTNFAVDFAMPRRQCREMRDWLNAVLDD